MPIFNRAFQLVERPRGGGLFTNKIALRVKQPNAEVYLVAGFEYQFGWSHLNEGRRIRTHLSAHSGRCRMRRRAASFLADAVKRRLSGEINASVSNCRRANHLVGYCFSSQLILVEDVTASRRRFEYEEL